MPATSTPSSDANWDTAYEAIKRARALALNKRISDNPVNTADTQAWLKQRIIATIRDTHRVQENPPSPESMKIVGDIKEHTTSVPFQSVIQKPEKMPPKATKIAHTIISPNTPVEYLIELEKRGEIHMGIYTLFFLGNYCEWLQKGWVPENDSAIWEVANQMYNSNDARFFESCPYIERDWFCVIEHIPYGNVEILKLSICMDNVNVFPESFWKKTWYTRMTLPTSRPWKFLAVFFIFPTEGNHDIALLTTNLAKSAKNVKMLFNYGLNMNERGQKYLWTELRIKKTHIINS